MSLKLFLAGILILLLVRGKRCDAMEETRYSGTMLEGARKALDDTITVYVAEMVRAAVARCPECDGDGVVEKCDWPGEHANRHQEPCPSCRPAEQSLPTDTEIEAWMARCSGVQYAGGGSVSMCIEDWDWAVEMLKRRTKPDATDQLALDRLRERVQKAVDSMESGMSVCDLRSQEIGDTVLNTMKKVLSWIEEAKR